MYYYCIKIPFLSREKSFSTNISRLYFSKFRLKIFKSDAKELLNYSWKLSYEDDRSPRVKNFCESRRFWMYVRPETCDLISQSLHYRRCNTHEVYIPEILRTHWFTAHVMKLAKTDVRIPVRGTKIERRIFCERFPRGFSENASIFPYAPRHSRNSDAIVAIRKSSRICICARIDFRNAILLLHGSMTSIVAVATVSKSKIGKS